MRQTRNSIYLRRNDDRWECAAHLEIIFKSKKKIQIEKLKLKSKSLLK